VGDPIEFAERVVEGVVTELVEPPRGPGAHVSEGIPAVDDDSAARIEPLPCKRRGQRFER
jgi:hypothetical protein